jgi:UDP-N-acetyl-D-galactosamine dehydrogenase
LELENDHTAEADTRLLENNENLKFSNLVESIIDCSIYIITVPAPINSFKTPDLGPLLSATNLIGGGLKRNDIVIYESTEYPG